MKVLLVAPIKDDFMGVATFPPVGLGYIATALRNDSHEVDILDCVKERFTYEDFKEYVEKKKPDVVGFTVFSLALKEVKKSLDIIKNVSRNTVTLVGGPHPSALAETVLSHLKDADYAFKGEGELGVPALLKCINNKEEDLSKVPGLIWREKDRTKINNQEFVYDLDSLGFPAWDLIKPHEYNSPSSIVPQNTAVLVSTRGCPYHCTFCSIHTITTRKIRKRSPEHLIQEMRLLKEDFNITNFVIPDDNFSFYRPFVEEFCHAVIREGQDFTFVLPNGVRLDTLDENLLTLMKKAGFSTSIALGIESGSERVLKLMKKGFNKKLVREKVHLLNSMGFRPTGYFILGFPGETKEEMYETINFAMELKLYRAAFTPFLPLPGTEAYNYLVSTGELPPDFDFSQLRTDKVIYTPKDMTLEELDNLRKKAVLRFYLRPRILWQFLTDYNSFRFALAKFMNIFITGDNVVRPEKTAPLTPHNN